MQKRSQEVSSSVVSPYKAFNRWREGFSKSAGQYAHSSVDNRHSWQYAHSSVDNMRTLVSPVNAGWGLGPEKPCPQVSRALWLCLVSPFFGRTRHCFAKYSHVALLRLPPRCCVARLHYWVLCHPYWKGWLVSILGTKHVSKSDEFSEKFQTPPPHFRKVTLQIF